MDRYFICKKCGMEQGGFNTNEERNTAKRNHVCPMVRKKYTSKHGVDRIALVRLSLVPDDQQTQALYEYNKKMQEIKDLTNSQKIDEENLAKDNKETK